MNRINLICLGVRDMEKSLAFYKNIGFHTFEEGNNPAIVFFNNQGTKLELFPLDELAKDINADNPPIITTGGFNGITLAINLKSEQEVDAFMDMVAVHGGIIVKKFWGGYSGYFRDPDGYQWEVAYAEVWKFDGNNMLIIENNGQLAKRYGKLNLAY